MSPTFFEVALPSRPHVVCVSTTSPLNTRRQKAKIDGSSALRTATNSSRFMISATAGEGLAVGHGAADDGLAILEEIDGSSPWRVRTRSLCRRPWCPETQPRLSFRVKTAGRRAYSRRIRASTLPRRGESVTSPLDGACHPAVLSAPDVRRLGQPAPAGSRRLPRGGEPCPARSGRPSARRSAHPLHGRSTPSAGFGLVLRLVRGEDARTNALSQMSSQRRVVLVELLEGRLDPLGDP